MLERMTIKLDSPVMNALKTLATAELRDFRLQAALIIRQELEHKGFVFEINQGIPPALENETDA